MVVYSQEFFLSREVGPMTPCRIDLSYERFGIIVRSFLPNEDAILILESGKGLLRARFAKRSNRFFSLGSQIRFNADEKSSGRIVILNMTIEAIPARWVVEDLLFLHHFCELCQRFVFSPEDAAGVFDLAQELWNEHLEGGCDIELKKLRILSKFFVILGSYVPFNRGAYRYCENFDTQMMKKKCIKRWLCDCIFAAEPSYALKTIHFLTT